MLHDVEDIGTSLGRTRIIPAAWPSDVKKKETRCFLVCAPSQVFL